MFRATLRAALLRAAAQTAAKNLPPQAALERVEIDGMFWELIVREKPPEAEMKDIHRAILDAAKGRGWLKVRTLARRAGYEYSPYFRGIVAGMVKDGLLVRGPEGVSLPQDNCL